VRRIFRTLKLPVFLGLFFAVSSTGCASCQQDAVCSMRGTINNPENKTMRRQMLSKGLGQFCAQMTSRNAPLKLAPESPVIGRFYAKDCHMKEMSNGDLFVEFGGFGYGYTNISKRMSFTMSGAVEYNQDFLVAKDECDIYAYFRTKNVASSNFAIKQIEQPVASFLNALSPIATNFGQQLVSGKLADGFTVIHDHENNDDFDLGIVELGKRPVHPYDVHGNNRITVENLRTEVHQNQRDFVGPITVDSSGRALYFTGGMDGAPAIDLLVYGQQEGENALGLYTSYPQSGPIPAAPVFSDVMPSGHGYNRTIPLAKGVYYLVLDNTPSAGPTMPPVNVFDDRAAVVSYVLQIGDAP
jgi:hypothetical protein